MSATRVKKTCIAARIIHKKAAAKAAAGTES